jgi:hypothetical protein
MANQDPLWSYGDSILNTASASAPDGDDGDWSYGQSVVILEFAVSGGGGKKPGSHKGLLLGVY